MGEFNYPLQIMIMRSICIYVFLHVRKYFSILSTYNKLSTYSKMCKNYVVFLSGT